MAQPSQRQPSTKITHVKSEFAITVFELLMMDGVSPETRWVIKKQWNNKFYYTVASCWYFLWVLYYARIREHQVTWKHLCQFSICVMSAGERAHRIVLGGRPVVLQMPRKRQNMGAVVIPEMKAVTSVKCSLFPHRLYSYTIWLNLSLCLYVLLLL
jgi:hypothetical protein